MILEDIYHRVRVNPMTITRGVRSYIYIYLYIYIHRERERETLRVNPLWACSRREKDTGGGLIPRGGGAYRGGGGAILQGEVSIENKIDNPTTMMMMMSLPLRNT